MIEAIWNRERPYCGREWCRNRSSFGRWSVFDNGLMVSTRWHLDRERDRYVVGARTTDKGALQGHRHVAMRPRLDGHRSERQVGLPAVFVCPECRTPIKVDAP